MTLFDTSHTARAAVFTCVSWFGTVLIRSRRDGASSCRRPLANRPRGCKDIPKPPKSIVGSSRAGHTEISTESDGRTGFVR